MASHRRSNRRRSRIFTAAVTIPLAGGGEVTPIWDLTNAVYAEKSFNFTTQESFAFGFTFKSDGTKFYVIGATTAYQYSCSTPWDISTGSYDSKSFDASTQDTAIKDLHFNDDGTIMYVLGEGTDTIYQYTLSTAWDISTASYATKSFSVNAQDVFAYGIFITSDGTKMYVAGNSVDTVYQYTMSTPWDISTASYDSKSFDASTQDTNPFDIYFNDDGTKMFLAGSVSKKVFQYTLSTAWDVSTASYDSIFADVSAEAAPIGYGLHIGNNGTIMYVLAPVAAIFQYTL